MKNLYLRAKCILNDHSNNNAPEYEENSINVEVTFPQAITADELSIRIYNNDSYKKMGVGYHYNKSYKKFKKSASTSLAVKTGKTNILKRMSLLTMR